MIQQPTQKIELGGADRTLRFDMNALCGLAEAGVDLASLKEQFKAGKVALSTIRAMLWALLITDSHDKGIENFSALHVGGWIDPSNMAAASKALAKLMAALPRSEAAESENPPQAE